MTEDEMVGWMPNHSSKASILGHSAFFTVQLSHLYMTMSKTIALARWTFVDKVMSLLFNMLSRLASYQLPSVYCVTCMLSLLCVWVLGWVGVVISALEMIN